MIAVLSVQSFHEKSGEESVQRIDKLANLVAWFPLGHRFGDAGLEMIANQDECESIERAPDRGDLLQNVDAICTVTDHLVQAAQLAFGTAEARLQVGVQRVVARSGFASRRAMMRAVIVPFRHTPGEYTPDACQWVK